MIKINFLGEVKSGNSSGRLLIAGYLASLALFIVASFFLYTSTSSAVDELKSETELLEKQLKSLEEKTKSVNDLERKRNELDSKLKVIATLKRSKSGPVRVLDDLNISLPERAWITSLAESENTLRIVGFALDNQTVAGWMKSLVESDFFESVDLVESKVALQQGAKIRNFTLDAKINYAGKEKVAPASGTPGAEASQQGATTVSAQPTASATALPSAETKSESAQGAPPALDNALKEVE